MEISGKKIVITGGARGMGRQFGIDLKALGATPYAIDVVKDNLDTLNRETGISGEVVDVTNEKDVEAFFARFTSAHGAPDILINNAGITADAYFVKKKGEIIRKFPLSGWDNVMKINLTGVFLCGREAAMQMVKHGVKGLIINISSISRAGNLGQTNYSATKAGVAAMTVTWAKELAQYGIRAAAIAPGYIRTEMTARINQKVIDEITAQIPLGRFGEMSEISKAVRFIIDCDFVNGRVIEVDGGHRI
jgi:3-oxoacyl-[acyl-carrier protein] reductase